MAARGALAGHPKVNGPAVRAMSAKLPTAARKVRAGERATYDRCALAMQRGLLVSWAIDDKAGAWLVQLVGGSDFVEMSQAEVVALLDELEVPAAPRASFVELDTPAPAVPKVKRAPKVAPVVAEVVPTAAAPVPTETEIVGLPAEVSDYLARLIHEPKRVYAEQVARALLAGEPVPAAPEADWAEKAAAKVRRLIRS